MSEMLIKAQEKLNSWQGHVNTEYKPKYHLSVPAGWLNDPNGFGFFQGKCHLFYQYHPYDTVWGPMHWGHWTSENLIDWEQEPVAMAPDREYDTAGCFSGTAIEDDGRYWIMYTGVIDEPSTGRTPQHQCLAWTDDGIHVEKAGENPVVGLDMTPEGTCPYDFRDPKLEKNGDHYRIVVAAKINNEGKVLSYSSADLKKWTYDGVYAEGFGEMSECPDCFEIDGRRVVISSIMACKDKDLVLPQPVVYMIGQEENGVFCAQTPMRDLDRGLDFYAPQTCLAPDGRRLMIGWAHAWGCETPMHRLGHGWTGTMTLIRECWIENDKLYQCPIRELENRRRNGIARENLLVGEKTQLSECIGACREMMLDINMREAEKIEIHLMETGDECVVLTYHKKDQRLMIDRSASGYSLTKEGANEPRNQATADVSLNDGMLSLHIFVDVSIVEVYANRGEKVLTCQAFPKGKEYGVSVDVCGKAIIEQLVSYEIE